MRNRSRFAFCDKPVSASALLFPTFLMSSQDELPPNPREARYRRAPMDWSVYPVTVLLIIACIITAVMSRLSEKREHLQKVDGLFFAGRPSEEQLDRMWEEHKKEFASSMGIRVDDQLSQKNRDLLDSTFREKVSFTDISQGQAWRLFTPMFIHFGVMHIVFNMMWLWDFGRMLEWRFRHLRFVLLVLGISAVANVVQAYLSGPGFGGMSGVNYGLFGFILVRQKFHPDGDVRLNPHTVPFLLIWLVVCFTGALGPIANGAHVAGLVAGCVIGWINAMMGGGWALIKRRREFQRAVTRSDSELHRCAVCQKTEKDDPNLDFRVGADGEEYCMDHLPRTPQNP